MGKGGVATTETLLFHLAVPALPSLLPEPGEPPTRNPTLPMYLRGTVGSTPLNRPWSWYPGDGRTVPSSLDPVKPPEWPTTRRSYPPWTRTMGTPRNPFQGLPGGAGILLPYDLSPITVRGRVHGGEVRHRFFLSLVPGVRVRLDRAPGVFLLPHGDTYFVPIAVR